ncbi:MAG TPA: glycosyltransferase [Candidatus Paceibacterota bacterium]|nr:glycosyltransferase [Candidatus Paceibacterota bacterium]
MKVLIASDTYWPHVNGASYFTQRLAAALVERGHEVAVISPSLTFGNDTQSRHGVTLFGVRSFPVFIVPNFRFVLPWIINQRIAEVIREFKPDIVHIQMHFLISRTTLSAAQKQNIPVVATNHFMPDNLTHFLHLPDSITAIIHAIAWKDAVGVLDKTYGITSPTKTANTFIEPWVGRTLPAVSNGIDLKRFNPSNDGEPARAAYKLPGKPKLLFVGRLDKEKNVDVVLRALKEALKEVDIHFVIAGHGADGKKLQKLTRTLGIEKNVTFTGFVPDELLPSLYAATDCFVNAGIAELQCIAAMEAMATGLPVLAANAVALPELVHEGKNGYVFEPGNVSELAGRIVEVFKDGAKRAHMGEHSLEIIAGHDINKTLEAFENFYRQALLTHASTPSKHYSRVL